MSETDKAALSGNPSSEGFVNQEAPPPYNSGPISYNYTYQQQPQGPPTYQQLYEEPKLQGVPTEFPAQQVEGNKKYVKICL